MSEPPYPPFLAEVIVALDWQHHAWNLSSTSVAIIIHRMWMPLDCGDSKAVLYKMGLTPPERTP